MNTLINPFSVKTPETLSPKDIASLFIDVFSDFPRLLGAEHTFLHGARGTGKSMMLRYLEPCVQLAAGKVEKISELTYYAVHMPIKSSNYSLSELERLDGAPYWLLAEHFLILNATSHILKSLSGLITSEQVDSGQDLLAFYREIIRLAENSGCDINDYDAKNTSEDCLNTLTRLFEKERILAKSYLAKLAFTKDLVPYNGSIFGYEEFFLPLIREVKSLSFTPQGPIFLMLDDADNLPLRMQKILNGWVSYRTTADLCLKISTQQRYQTWRTTQGMLIETSHDFSEIDISAVYTSKNFSHYYEKVEKVVQRRLELAGIKNVTPEEFFPINPVKVDALNKIKAEIGEKWDNGERVSSRRSDDITRYAVSEYLKLLAKTKKTNTYSYSGFKSMVDISSGMIRFFLEPAARMYAEILSSDNDQPVNFIPPKIQDRILYKWSEEYVLEDFERLTRDETSIKPYNRNKVEKLKCLISSFGECFQTKLVSNDSERRFISFMVSRTPSGEVQEILDLAVEWGYLNVKTIARKEGFGRNRLYTLNRRLTPYYKLDPTGYAAHLSVSPEHLEIAINNSGQFVRERLKAGSSNGVKLASDQQILKF
ncbi:hypothetical protein CMT41_11580 [Colwellia sp. MT41]|uniref:ORC-CDC6 family AAA ATPase n=1 Tax=Colwellia sp. MT41 TaxID=58049 RepID=UPI0007176F02|nr:hypothetical protein [Colwellia sp. MT41]ALO35289.1 hypothetical protein CMT41_11580 [Colwellia sp. MT41]